MEQYFLPTRKFQDLWEESPSYSADEPFEHGEVQLAIPVEDFLITCWDWEELGAFAYGDNEKIIWITEDTLLVGGFLSEDITNYADFLYLLHADFTVTSGGKEQMLTLYHHNDSAMSIGACSVFWRAIETSNCYKICIESMMMNGIRGESFPSGPILSQFLRGSPLLQRVEFEGFHFWEEHCRAFATIQRTDLDVTLNGCTLEPLDAEDPFIEWFRHNQIVTTLDNCGMGSRVLQALSGNNFLKRLLLNMIDLDQCSEEHYTRALSNALATNQGIEDLGLTDFKMSDEICRLLFRSLSTHPRIRHLSICFTFLDEARRTHSYSAETKSTMLNAILRMLHLNTVLLTITLPDGFKNEEVYRNLILPRLEMNRSSFEAQRQAVKRSDPSIRPQLVGRALHVVRYNPDLVFRFLSENVPVFVRTE
jgi:hypothetical protein